MDPWVATKIPSLSLRAPPSALGLRDGIFNATLGPIELNNSPLRYHYLYYKILRLHMGCIRNRLREAKGYQNSGDIFQRKNNKVLCHSMIQSSIKMNAF